MCRCLPRCLQAGLWGLCHRDMVGGYSQRGSIYHPLWVFRRDAHEQHPGQGGGSCSTQSSCLAPQLRKVMDFIPLLLWPQFGFREDRQASPKPAALHISK